VECEESLAAILKEKYLDWMYLLRDINKTRALYKRLRRTVGLREQFFKQYIDIENSQVCLSASSELLVFTLYISYSPV